MRSTEDVVAAPTGKEINIAVSAAKLNNFISTAVAKSSNCVKTSPSNCEIVASEIKLYPRFKKSPPSPTSLKYHPFTLKDESADGSLCSLSDSLFSDSPTKIKSPKSHKDNFGVDLNALSNKHGDFWGGSSALNDRLSSRQYMGGGFQPSPPVPSTMTSPRLRSAHAARSVLATLKRQEEKEKVAMTDTVPVEVLMHKVKNFYESNFGELHDSAQDLMTDPATTDISTENNTAVLLSDVVDTVELQTDGSNADIQGVQRLEEQEQEVTLPAAVPRVRIPLTVEIPTVGGVDSHVAGDESISLGSALASMVAPVRQSQKLSVQKMQQVLFRARLRGMSTTKSSKLPNEPIRINESDPKFENQVRR